MKSVFGKFNPFIDETGHILLTLIIILILSREISFYEKLALFVIGIAIDLDHLLNPIIAKLFGTKATITPSKEQLGVTVKVLHGIDVALLISLFYFYFENNIYMSIGIFTVLVLHELWDYFVYDYTYKELFLITRMGLKFKPGTRKKHVGIIFDQDSLPR